MNNREVGMWNATDEGQLLEDAANAVARETGLKVEVMEGYQPKMGAGEYDGWLKIRGTDTPPMVAEVKKWIAQANFEGLTHRLGELPQPAVLVADYINPMMAGRLKELQIQFMDAAGNAYLNQPGCYIYIIGNKGRPQRPKGEAPRRAFNATGLKVLYTLLKDERMLNAAYRDIADKADVALGTVGWVINDLKEAGYLFGKGKLGDREFMQKDKLIERWATNYIDHLKPKIFLGNYVGMEPNWWRYERIKEVKGCWGGETAAALLTHDLKPKTATIYIPKENVYQAQKHFKLKKILDKEKMYDAEAAVKVYEKFWKDNDDFRRNDFAHPILIYADLLGTNEPRNLEIAKIIRDEYFDRFN